MKVVNLLEEREGWAERRAWKEREGLGREPVESILVN